MSEHIHDSKALSPQELVKHCNELVDENNNLLEVIVDQQGTETHLREEVEELEEDNETLQASCNKWIGITGISLIGNFFFLLERFL